MFYSLQGVCVCVCSFGFVMAHSCGEVKCKGEVIQLMVVGVFTICRTERGGGLQC